MQTCLTLVSSVIMNRMQQNSPSGIYSGRNMTKPVHFYFEAPEARAVHLAGDFNGWNPGADAMTRRVDGWWFIEVDLTLGYHQYHFLVDGQARLDPRANGLALNEKGEEVSVVAVS